MAWVAAAWAVGTHVDVGRLLLRLPPLYARWAPAVEPGVVVAVIVGAAVVVGLPVVAERARWPVALLGSWAMSAVFAVVLAAADGLSAVAAPLTHDAEYRAVFDAIDRRGVGSFTSTFTEQIGDYPTHVRGHPVGATLVYWWPEQFGFRGPGWSAALTIVVGTSVVVSVGIVVRRLAGEAAARRCLPFVVVGPAAVWVATSADAVFAGVVAVAVALAVVACDRERGWVPALMTGAVSCLGLHLTYGAVLMLLPVAVVVVTRRRWTTTAWAAGGAMIVLAGFAAAGFWWFDGLAVTRDEYALGAGGYRPYWYFATLANPAALAIVLGPAVVVALTRIRDRRLLMVVGSALVGVVLADLSGLSKGEVERIWLPFVPFLAASTAVLVDRRRVWLGAQVAVALALQITLETPW